VRDRIGVPLLNLGRVQRFIGEKASQLQVSYRNGPMGDGRRHLLSGLWAGDRVPDRDGLYDALGPAWALIGPVPLADLARERLGDVVALRGDEDALLVRPDGHLAWRGADAAGLRAWLDGALGRPQGVLAR
jgi:4,5-epoxidase